MEDDDAQHVARALVALRLEGDGGVEEAARTALIWGPETTAAAAAALRHSARRLGALAGACAVAARRLKVQ